MSRSQTVPLIYKATGWAMDAMDAMFKSQILVEGQENLVDKPTLFVVNHFTRIETFILPHAIYRHTKKQVHSLADANLFGGKIGDYLHSLGAFSTRDQFRNRRIISELMTGEYNWVIFPEGLMVKNKQIYERGRLWMSNPERTGPPHTGAAVLAMKAELIKRRYLDAVRAEDKDTMEYYEKRYNFNGTNDLSFKEIVVIPVNITYYPIRSGKNLLSQIAQTLIHKLPERLEEELEVEGNILFSETDITVYFGAPINVFEYIDQYLPLVKTFLPFMSDRKQDDLILWRQKSSLTQRFMQGIYTKVAINYEHLFCASLRYLSMNTIDIQDFNKALYLTASEIWNLDGRRTHQTLSEQLIRTLCDEEHEPQSKIEGEAVNEKILRIENGAYFVDRSFFSLFQPFHQIRLTNIVRVISNEIEPLKQVIKSLRTNINTAPARLTRRVVQQLLESDQKRFDKDYKIYYDKELSKPETIGRPFLLKGRRDKVGVVLSHGYLAAPEEVRLLAEHLHASGHTVYCVCLKGHGTAPRQLKDISFDDWLVSYNQGYAIIKHLCRHIICGGFSSGGLVALLSASRKKIPPAGIFCINAALRLQDLKSYLVPGVLRWNELLEKLNVERGKLEYVKNNSENPDINYSRNYLRGVFQLEKLISACQTELPKVKSPALIIQADKDPIVHPTSGGLIYEKIVSELKYLESLAFERHVIVRKEGSEKVFDCISKFITALESRLDFSKNDS